MPAEYMTTKETAEYLGINEKQVYALIKSGSIPCTRVTGKWVFPKKLIDRWINENALKDSSPLNESKRKSPGAILAAGSNDPLLDILINKIWNHGKGRHIFSGVTGSTEGVRLLGNGEIDIAWCHLANPETGEYNTESMAGLVPGKKIAIVHLFHRELGFVFPGDKTYNDISFSSIVRDHHRFINRQRGAGTRILIDHFMDKEGVGHDLINGYDEEVNTHLEVGLNILSGRAEVGFATSAVASILGLGFKFIISESFDMALAQETFFLDEVQDFIETLKSEDFREMVSYLGNYNFNKSGKIIYSAQ